MPLSWTEVIQQSIAQDSFPVHKYFLFEVLKGLLPLKDEITGTFVDLGQPRPSVGREMKGVAWYLISCV